jgi:hypothetical protein
MITLKLIETNMFTRYPCTICGGYTDKTAVLCEGEDTINGGGVRACEQCLEAGQDQIDARLKEHIAAVDARLKEHISAVEEEAQMLRKLVNQIQVPTFAEWEAAMHLANGIFGPRGYFTDHRDVDDYFGLCPFCLHTDGYINIGREHWFFCKEHKAKWCAGSNLCSWRDDTEDSQRKIFDELDFGSFKIVEPVKHKPLSEEELAAEKLAMERGIINGDIPF